MAISFLWLCCALYWAPLISQLAAQVIGPLIKQLLLGVTSWVTILSGAQIMAWVIGWTTSTHAWQFPLAHVLAFRCGLVDPVLQAYYSVWASLWLGLYLVGNTTFMHSLLPHDLIVSDYSKQVHCSDGVVGERTAHRGESMLQPVEVATLKDAVVAGAAAASQLYGRFSSNGVGEGVFVEVLLGAQAPSLIREQSAGKGGRVIRAMDL
jgi:hypothetical protein